MPPLSDGLQYKKISISNKRGNRWNRNRSKKTTMTARELSDFTLHRLTEKFNVDINTEKPLVDVTGFRFS